MVIRTIKTNSGKKYSNLVSSFIDRGEYIEYKRNFFTVEKIYKKSIVYESDTSIIFLVAGLVLIFMAAALVVLSGLKGLKAYNDSQELAQVKQLIEQPSIDLLTEYINQYQDDKTKISNVELVKAEVEKRCSALESELKHRKLIHSVIDKDLIDSYKSSCPEVINQI